MGSSRDDLKALSSGVQDGIGFALYHAQIGQRHSSANVLKGFSGAGVLEVIEDDAGGTYRAVYTVKFAGAVYVLHIFQKKSKRGAVTPKSDIDLVRRRLTDAAAHYEAHKHEFQISPQKDK
jgi:phage-related protein